MFLNQTEKDISSWTFLHIKHSDYCQAVHSFSSYIVNIVVIFKLSIASIVTY